MQEIGENTFASEDARMRKALTDGDARTYAILCDRLGIPYSARNPHLYSEGREIARGASTLGPTRHLIRDKSSIGLDVSSCFLSEAAMDYLRGLGDRGLEREDYLARIRQVLRLGAEIPSSLRPRVGASEEELRDLYSALASKARSIPKRDSL